MSIIVSSEDIKTLERLRVISQIAPIKEKMRSFERKYGCEFQRFEESIKLRPESFESWDDLIEWKAYDQALKELELKLKRIEDAADVGIAPG